MGVIDMASNLEHSNSFGGNDSIATYTNSISCFVNYLVLDISLVVGKFISVWKDVGFGCVGELRLQIKEEGITAFSWILHLVWCN